MFPLSDPIFIFTLLILTMLAMPLLAERLKLPDIVLLLGAGMLLGPNGSGLLERNTAVTLFGSVGLLYIMFLAGLEIDLYRFGKTRRRSVGFGLLTFAIPQGVGTLICHYFLGFPWSAALLLASMFASHTLLAYPLASRLGITRSEPVAVTVGATIITDMLALIVLAVVADTTRGIPLTPLFWASILGGLALFVFLTWWVIPRLTRWFFNQVTETSGAQFLFVLTVVCGCAYLSHFAKMEPIIGAFLAGVSFNRLIPEHSVLMSRVTFAGNTLFIPFFLISVGMLVDPVAVMENPRSWLIGGTMIITVTVTKYVASHLAGCCYGYSYNARNVMFGLSVVQAAATLAAVLVGHDLGLLDKSVLNGAIAMIAITCPLGVWTVDRYGRHLANEAHPITRPPLILQHLMVPVSNPLFATKMLDLAFLLCDRAHGGTIHPINIVRDEDNIESAITQGEKLLAECLTHAASADIPVNPSVRVDVNISDGLVRAVKQLHVSLTLTGWSGKVSRLNRLFGSVMESLINTCPSRILLCRLMRPLNTTRTLVLLLPPLSERRSDMPTLLTDAKRLAQQMGAELHAHLAGQHSDALQQLLETAKPSCPLRVRIFSTLPEARAHVLEESGTDNLLLLPCERSGSLLWSPTLDKFTTQYITRFPKNNLLLAYPALGSYQDEMPLVLEEDLDAHDSVRHVACDLPQHEPLETALRKMIQSAFPDDPSFAQTVFTQIRQVAAVYPVALAPNVVLLHTHCEQIDTPVLVVGQGNCDWTFADIAGVPHIVLILLNPTSRSPEQHLKTLADLGRCLRVEKVASALNHTLSANETVEWLTKSQPTDVLA